MLSKRKHCSGALCCVWRETVLDVCGPKWSKQVQMNTDSVTAEQILRQTEPPLGLFHRAIDAIVLLKQTSDTYRTAWVSGIKMLYYLFCKLQLRSNRESDWSCVKSLEYYSWHYSLFIIEVLVSSEACFKAAAVYCRCVSALFAYCTLSPTQ